MLYRILTFSTRGGDNMQKIKVLQKSKGNSKITRFTSFEDLPVMLNVKDIINILGLSTAKTYTLIKTEEFPKMKLGKRLIVPKDRFIEWINTNTH